MDELKLRILCRGAVCVWYLLREKMAGKWTKWREGQLAKAGDTD